MAPSFRSLSLSLERKERRKEKDAYLFLARRLRLGAALGRGSALRCGRGEMKRMTVANSELGAGNEGERPGDCFAGGLSAIIRVAKAWMEGWREMVRREGVGTRERSVLASLIKKNFTSHSDARPPDVEKKNRAKKKRLTSRRILRLELLEKPARFPSPFLDAESVNN